MLEQASLISAVAESNVSEVVYGTNITEIIRRFPLKDMESLKQYESRLNDDNMQQNVRKLHKSIRLISNFTFKEFCLFKNEGNPHLRFSYKKIVLFHFKIEILSVSLQKEFKNFLFLYIPVFF